MGKGDKKVYPVVFQKLDDGYLVYVPDFDVNTQGEDLAEAMAMARDVIGITGLSLEDDLHQSIPEPSPLESVQAGSVDDQVLMIDIDFDAYRRKNDRRAVRVNVTVPSWLNEAAKEAGINFSATIQKGLQEELKELER